MTSTGFSYVVNTNVIGLLTNSCFSISFMKSSVNDIPLTSINDKKNNFKINVIFTFKPKYITFSIK